MKVILSRKGFDSSNGGIPSPIMPDGTLLSLPIPIQEDKVDYSELTWNGKTYSSILNQLAPGKNFGHCHVDPDIRENRSVQGWKPAFGQTGAAQGTLINAGVEKGDIFLFFGWFRGVEETAEGYRYIKRNQEDFYFGNDLQVIYGYLQVGEILTDSDEIAKYPWHPHANSEVYTSKNNVLYIPTEKLSIAPELKGYGTLDFRKDRVLTMEGMTRGTWNEYDFLMPGHIYPKKKNSAKGKGIYYSGIWQELVVDESEGLMQWVKKILL